MMRPPPRSTLFPYTTLFQADAVYRPQVPVEFYQLYPEPARRGGPVGTGDSDDDQPLGFRRRAERNRTLQRAAGTLQAAPGSGDQPGPARVVGEQRRAHSSARSKARSASGGPAVATTPGARRVSGEPSAPANDPSKSTMLVEPSQTSM